MLNWLFSKFIARKFLEEFKGDLEEMYQDRVQEKGKLIAKFMYLVDWIHLTIGFSSSKAFKSHRILMTKTMFKIAVRSALKQKQFTILNLVGLVVGIAACITIGIYIHDESTYDQFHKKADRIYRINQPNIWDNWSEQSSSTGPNVAIALREDVPEFEEVTRILSMGSQFVTHTGKERVDSYKEELQFAVEENFFDVFTFEFFDGNPETALSKPMSMVMTYSTAVRYFGFENAIGKTLEVKDWDGSMSMYTVRGVIADVPKKSHLQFDILVSMSSFQENMDRDGWKWIWTAFSTYGLVKENIDISMLQDKLQTIPPKWAPPTTERIFNQTYEEFTAGNPWKLNMQPVKEIYLASEANVHRFGPDGNPLFIKIFGAIGILVLILSSINFMNLYTARASNRSKEVGIRKVLGSDRGALIKQFIFESTLYVAVSTALGVLLVQVSLGWFNIIAAKDISLSPYLSDPIFGGVLITFVIVLGFLAGSYPAFYLSSFKPVQVLKGKMTAGFSGKGVRNILVITQFTISISLIICSFFVQRQLSYASSLDVGFVKDNVLQIHNIEQLGFDTESVKTALLTNSKVNKIGKSFGVPPYIWSGDRYKTDEPGSPVVQLSNLRAEQDYLDLLGVEFLMGRNFEVEHSTDKYAVVLNEEAVRVLGWANLDINSEDSPIGRVLKLASGDEDEFEVIGVVKDFNFNSIHQKINPIVIINHQNDRVWDYGAGLSYYSLRVNPESVKSSEDLQLFVEELQTTMSTLDSSVPFEYSFLDQEFENTFRSESQMSNVLSIFTALALLIACLGLYGLSAFSSEMRTKELGIRKVLGANTGQIVLLFSSEFTKLILISILIAIPIAYLTIDYWLDNFAYRTPIDAWVFVVATLGALLIATITISYQSLRTANRNPVDTLKDD